jgi:hypothetical protein
MGVELGITLCAALGCLVTLWVQRRSDERRAWREWDQVLGPHGSAAYEALRRNLLNECSILKASYLCARKVAHSWPEDEAARILGQVSDLMGDLAPTMSRLLVGMARLSRMVSAIAPVPPLRHRDFKSEVMSRLAGRGTSMQLFLVSAAERFRLRAWLLGHGFSVLTRYMVRATRLLQIDPRPASPTWSDIEKLLEDVEILTAQSLECAHALLLSADRRP